MYKLTALLVVSSSHVADSALRGVASQSNNSPNQQHDRTLELSQVELVSGGCTVDNFVSAVGGRNVLASWLGDASYDDDTMQQILTTKCANALQPQM